MIKGHATRNDIVDEIVTCGRAFTSVLRTFGLPNPKGHATSNDIVEDIVDVSSSMMVFNVANIASSASIVTKSLTISLRVAGPLEGYDY